MRNKIGCLGLLLCLYLLGENAFAQVYTPDNYYPSQYPYPTEPQQDPRMRRGRQPQMREQFIPREQPMANLQYDQRDAEMILREQMSRSLEQQQMPQPSPYARQEVYDNYYGHRIQDEGQVRAVMTEARYIAGLIRKPNAKPFIVVDKRNYQFYLYAANGRLLRIGPVAIGKGRTDVGAFETPVGIFPVRTKVPVDDWIRPDWYFIEEGEQIPQRWEDRRVPGFFRYKIVFDGARYIHYAEATGGRLTHGCLGLDWEDAEAVFHTLEVGSYCIVVDDPFLARLARGEFPIKLAEKPKKPEPASAEVTAEATSPESGKKDKMFRNMW